jgi:hydrogenase maturation protein HypF
MAFVLELQSSSSQSYLKNYVASIAREFGIPASLSQSKGVVTCAFASAHPRLQPCIEAVAERLPASWHLTGSRHYETDDEPESLPELEAAYPLGLGLCPSCQKELFDPSSRRYYYPFTHCAHCGGQYAFFDGFPFTRSNTSFSYLRPCKACDKESEEAGRREGDRLNSCHACGVPVRLQSGGRERYANDAGSFRTMFEVAAGAVADGKTLLVKTTMGYRRFFTAQRWHPGAVLMMIRAERITEHLAMTNEEFNALLSIERPILHAAVKDETLQAFVGRSADVKYPDDGFTILLAKELQRLGYDYVAYEAADADAQADLRMEYDLEISAQSDQRLFISKDFRFVAGGERVSFPSRLASATQTLGIAHGLAGIPEEGAMLFDRSEHFESTTVGRAVVLEGGSDEPWHSLQRTVAQDEASFMAVIAEHSLLGSRCVGAHFDGEPSCLYYDGRKVIRVVPPITFTPAGLLEKIASLREGSDRLVANFKTKMPDVFAKLEALQAKEGATLFEAVSVILEADEPGFAGVNKAALRFVGKGGLQVDTHVRDNRFDHTAFLASIISYRLAGVDRVLIAYSIFESFGDYFSDLLQQIQGKTKAEHLLLSGGHFAQPSLFGRMQRNLKLTPPRLSVNHPIGRENAVVGCVYL